ncbi:RidA family protein [Mycolicibacterium sp. YH-1]|uniref:RidA family protein n=1 Tax=Mycolicibacterium sp. YH-1 TaxID=2908837 RepID=UPI001F4BFC14|nr:RidA family protein [Mycolicibacterium sp. YH-1]UNB52970.1 RidA family protein [Mycolicibacterium sp. YH-1]
MATETQIEIRRSPFTWAVNAEYSQAARIGDLVYTAGQGGFGDDGELVSLEFTTQTRQALRNVEAALAGHGAGLDSVIKMTVHVANPAHYALFQQVRREFFQAPWPASTAVSSQLLVEGMLVEIEAIAAVDAKRTYIA